MVPFAGQQLKSKSHPSLSLIYYNYCTLNFMLSAFTDLQVVGIVMVRSFGDILVNGAFFH